MILLVSILLGLVHAEWAIELDPAVDPAVFAAEHELVLLKKRIEYMEHVYFFESSKKRSTVSVRSLSGVRQAEEQVVRKHYTRNHANGDDHMPDPLYLSQWHLHTSSFSINSDRAGNLTGAGITIAIVDDGLQHTHPDLKANYDPTHSYDFNDNDYDPSPSANDGHGTAAAGVAGAVKENGHCGRGVATSVKLVGIRAIAAAISDYTEAQALTHEGLATVDIYSSSWGPSDDGITMAGPGMLTMGAFAYYAGQYHGRHGKGSIYIWAGGNGRDVGDSCAYDGYSSNMYTISVGSINHQGEQAWYSEGCAALFGVTPSSGAMKGISTVDLIGSAGYDAGECTANFGGTSASAPMAAGMIALMLEARPDLTWRDVKHVIAKSGIQIHAADPDWHVNGRGYKHSHKYGFGVMRVPSLLASAREHVLVPRDVKVWRSVIKPLNTGTIGNIPCVVNHTVVSNSGITFIEHVTLYVSISHPQRGNVRVSLISPSGTVSVMGPERPRDHTYNYPPDGWTFLSVRHWGESVVDGVWTVMVNDTNARTVGQGHLNAYGFALYGF